MSFRSGKRRIKYAAIEGDESCDLLRFACGIDAKHSKYVFCRWNNVPHVPMPRSCITWVKSNWSMGDLAHEHGRQTELVLFYPGINHDFPIGRPGDVVQGPVSGNGWHPTEKPVWLMSRLVSWTRGLVVDPFMGSGSTGIACIGLGRPFIGIEADQVHFSTACRRIELAHRQAPLFHPSAPEPPQQDGLFPGVAS